MTDKILTTSKTRLGANYNDDTESVDFRLFSKNATHAILCVFDEPVGADPIMSLDMQRDGDIFGTSVKSYALFNLKRPFYYGYRVFGPNFEYSHDYMPGTKIGFKSKVDEHSNRFNPNKLAYDPYSLELTHAHSSVCLEARDFRSNNNYLFDNAKTAPKSVFVMNSDMVVEKVAPRALKDEIIGEVHLKDFTQNTDCLRNGTYLGAAEYAQRLRETGITMVEFLPLNEFDSEAEIGNHWGYMPLGYFTLARKYTFDKAPGASINEFRQMINAFHQHGVKVCMDIVFNHTGEGKIYNNNKEDANLFSYALIDNATYYKIENDGIYTNNSWCGNDFNVAQEPCEELIVDALEYWTKQGVDAFRFDLAAALMDVSKSEEVHFDAVNGFVGKIKNKLAERGITVNAPDVTADGISLIAEPWTCGCNESYQLGNFPDYWAEWNDISKNTLRASTMRANSTDVLGLRYLIEGTPQKFKGLARSVNFINSHDGFTLWDANSYDKKSPETQCGSDWELCSSYGGNEFVRNSSIRRQAALLMLSYGIPMLQIGDIFLHSKNGNNNSYNLDNATNWINYDIDDDKLKLSEFIRQLMSFRHRYEVFTNLNYAKKLEFLYKNGQPIEENDTHFWSNGIEDCLCYKINDILNNFYVAISRVDEPFRVRLPDNSNDKKWNLIFDTAGFDFNMEGREYGEPSYKLNPLSVAVFIER